MCRLPPLPGGTSALTPLLDFDTLYRTESRRVLATLIRLLGDFDLAEEALHEAFAAAVEQWPREGVPANPRAWLVSAGRFKAIDGLRRQARFEPLDANRTRVRLVMAYEPEGTVENAGDSLGIFSRRVETTVKDFKEYIESRGRESGGWRGEVHDSRPT